MSRGHVVVIGAAGFVGTYLVDELLERGYAVTAADLSEAGRRHYESRGVACLKVDITRREDFDQLRVAGATAVVHLAACQPANVSEAGYDAADYIRVNVLGTLNVLDFCRRSGAGKIVYASSHRNTQGLWAANKAISEGDGRSIKYDGEYAMFSIAESAAQDCVSHYQAQYGLPGIVFRLPPVYGYGPHTEIFKDGKPLKTGFQVFIERAMACEPLELWGDAATGRDIVYVKDVVAAFVKAIEHSDATGLFNITSGKYLSLREQAETIAELFWGCDSPPRIVERPDKDNHMDSFLYDISRARRELGWSPAYSFRDMLVDYRIEAASGRYSYLVDKRLAMLKST